MSAPATTHSPLIDLLRLMTPDEREQFAALAGTEVSYLYQIGGYHRKPNVVLAIDIEDAARLMHTHSKGRLPLITARQIADSFKTSGLTE